MACFLGFYEKHVLAQNDPASTAKLMRQQTVKHTVGLPNGFPFETIASKLPTLDTLGLRLKQKGEVPGAVT